MEVERTHHLQILQDTLKEILQAEGKWYLIKSRVYTRERRASGGMSGHFTHDINSFQQLLSRFQSPSGAEMPWKALGSQHCDVNKK